MDIYYKAEVDNEGVVIAIHSFNTPDSEDDYILITLEELAKVIPGVSKIEDI